MSANDILHRSDLVEFTNAFELRYVRQTADACWEWNGAINTSGYGQFGFRRFGDRAHRIAWVLANGAIPGSLCVLHRCDNRPCVNPAHLFLGTKADNNRDMHQKGRNRHPKGFDNAITKLSVADVYAIYGDRRDARIIAAEYGITRDHVYHLKVGSVRKDLHARYYTAK